VLTMTCIGRSTALARLLKVRLNLVAGLFTGASVSLCVGKQTVRGPVHAALCWRADC